MSMTGRLGQDAKLSYTSNNDAICNFSVSLTSGYGDKAQTSWVNASLWGKRGEVLAPMLLKGTLVGVTGEISLRPYTAKDGTEKSSLECRVNTVSLLSSKADSDSSKQESKPASKVAIPADFEDSIPF